MERSRRNIGILAHIDAGKTTVTEHLLHLGGVVRRPGTVDAGTTVTDWMLEEQERGITIASAAITFPWRGVDVTVIDTPGHVDFTLEVERALRVLDGAVLVVSGPDGVQAQTETVWHQVLRRGAPAIAFVNKLDRPGFDPERVLADLRERLGVVPVPLQWPLAWDERRVELLDVLTGERLVWDVDPDVRAPIPPAVEPAIGLETLRASALERIVDAVASHDDALAEEVLAGGTPSIEVFRRALALATRARACVPIVWGAARWGVGIGPLADAIVTLLPEPGPTVAFERGGAHQVIDPDGAPAAFVFKTEPRRGGVTLAFLRVFASALASRAPLVRTPDGAALGSPALVKVAGQDYDPVARLEAGEVGALLYEGDATVLPRTGDTIGPAVLPFTFEPIRPPDPVIERVVEAPDASSHERMMAALRRLVADDPSLRLGTDRETGAAILSGMGELHLEVAIARAGRASALTLRAGAPRARTRWLLTGAEATGEAEVTHPTGRSRVRVAAQVRSRPAGATTPSVIVRPTIERADLREALLAGLASGLGHDGLGARQALDVDVIVTDVEVHGGDAIAPVMYRDAAAWATERALVAGGLAEAEPWGTLVVTAPDAAIGRVVGDLARRRARIQRTESRGPIQEIVAEAPLAELIGYATALRNLTAGRGLFSVEPSFYRPRGS
ncbi:MAG: GTP-binding protein [Deltaproteobacteria bacterium]|nr:GTP-binding protein [Deltaproteobacteria bacterium]